MKHSSVMITPQLFETLIKTPLTPSQFRLWLYLASQHGGTPFTRSKDFDSSTSANLGVCEGTIVTAWKCLRRANLIERGSKLDRRYQYQLTGLFHIEAGSKAFADLDQDSRHAIALTSLAFGLACIRLGQVVEAEEDFKEYFLYVAEGMLKEEAISFEECLEKVVENGVER